LLASRPHVEQAYRSCMDLLSLGRQYTAVRLEGACTYALKHKLTRYRQIKAILESNLDLKKASTPAEKLTMPTDHANVRGPYYYH